MSSKTILLLFVALAVAGGTAFFVKSRIQEAPVEQAEQAPKQRILVAKDVIPAGEFVRGADHLNWVDWPEEAILAYHITESGATIADYEGAVSRRQIKAGEAITNDLLIKPGSGGFLSAVLEAGTRAITIAVSPTSGTAGFIFPGDRVDLIVTHRMMVQESATSNPVETVISETFVEDARVVAVDQMLDNPEKKAILAKTVTVEVKPEQAEMVSVAQDMGKVSFALRSLARAKPVEEEGSNPVILAEDADYLTQMGGPELPIQAPARITRDRDISNVLKAGSKLSPRVTIIRGNETEYREFFGDKQ